MSGFLEVIGERNGANTGTVEIFETALEVLQDFREAITDGLRTVDTE